MQGSSRVSRAITVFSLLLSVAFLSGAIVHAQQQKEEKSAPVAADAPEGTKSAAQNYTLRVHSDLVVLDVVINDSKGAPVGGLTQHDLRVYENETPEEILSFQYTGENNAESKKPITVHSTAELDDKEPEAPVSIVVLDELTTTFEDRYFARYSLEKYLDKQGEALQQPVMLVARNLKHIMVLHDFTTSKSEILSTLRRHLAQNDWQAKDPGNATDQFVTAFASLMELAEATQGHHGHKNVIWVGRGFPRLRWSELPASQQEAVQTAIAACTNMLRDSRVTLYTVDPAALATSSEATMNSIEEFDVSDNGGGQLDFDGMAQATGGQALHGRNDVDKMIGESLRNGANFYTLSYRPAPPVEEKPKEFRKIRIVPVNAQYVASTRFGYFSVPPDTTSAQVLGKTEKTDKGMQDDLAARERFDLAAACGGLMVFDGIRLTIARDEHAANLYHVSFPANQLRLLENDGTVAGDIKLLTLGYDLHGKLIHSGGEVIHIHLKQLDPAQKENRTVTVNATLDMPPAAARIRVVVRASNSGNIGADNVFLVDRNTLKDPATGVKADSSAK